MWPWIKIQIVPPVNIPIPTKLGSKMGGEFTYPKMGAQDGFDNHCHVSRKEHAWLIDSWDVSSSLTGTRVVG